MMNHNHNSNDRPANTAVVDLFTPSNRFVSASRLHGRLHRWWILLGRYWWVILLVLLLVLVPVYLWSASLPARYESKARMWLTGKINIYEGRVYTEELINYLGTQAELLRSPEIQSRALARLREETHFDPAAPRADEGPDGGRQLNRLRMAKFIWHLMFPSTPAAATHAPPPFPFHLEVAEGSKSSTLELRATGAQPAATRAFLNCLMEEYLDFKQEARDEASDRTTASLAAERDQLKRQLQAQKEKLHAFQASNNAVFLQQEGNSAGSRLATLDRQLASLRTELRLLERLDPAQWVEKETALEGLKPGESLPGESAGGELAASLAGPQQELFKANQQMQLLKAKHKQLSGFLKPAHPKMVKLEQEIATQEQLVQISLDEARKQLAHRRQVLELQIQNLETASKEWDDKALEASRKMADYEQLRQDLQRIQTAYDKTLDLIQTVDVSKQVGQENVGILESASVAMPTHPLFRNMAIALAGSLVVSFGFLYCIALFKDDFASLAELEDQLAEDVVGLIPAISLKKPGRRRGIETLGKQRFEFLESFRTIRSALLFMGNGGVKPKTILIASSVPEEGKSTVALYLAATLARANARVLLIDADMRQGALHKFFGAPGKPGLAECLEGETPFDQAIVSTGLDNLCFLPAGEVKRNPGELVLSPEWEQLLSEARDQFDYILVDTPPVLATDDAAALSPKMDGVLFVVRGAFTSARMARGALDLLRQRHVRVLGLIFNRAVSSPYEHHAYQRYRASYSWQPQAAKEAPRLPGNPVPEGSGG